MNHPTYVEQREQPALRGDLTSTLDVVAALRSYRIAVLALLATADKKGGITDATLETFKTQIAGIEAGENWSF